MVICRRENKIFAAHLIANRLKFSQIKHPIVAKHFAESFHQQITKLPTDPASYEKPITF
jgi:hypothetical protein